VTRRLLVVLVGEVSSEYYGPSRRYCAEGEGALERSDQIFELPVDAISMIQDRGLDAIESGGGREGDEGGG